MGSVGDDYKCPWCGRIGNGGYAADGIGYPICTEGDHDCLSAFLRGEDLAYFRSQQLKWIIGTFHPVLTPDLLVLIARLIGPA